MKYFWLLGLGAIIYGCYLMWPPVAWIFGGLILCTVGFTAYEQQKKQKQQRDAMQARSLVDHHGEEMRPRVQ